jgi:hypothetical protein
MEVDFDRAQGLQGANENREVHEARGNKDGSRGVNETEREQLQR